MIYNYLDMECNRHIFCHFGPFFALPHYLPWKWKFGINVQNAWRYYAFINVYQKWRSWCMLPDIRDDIFCPFFCPLILLTPQKSKILQKWEKTPGDIIILPMCTKNHNHMRYDSWDAEWDTWFSVILDNFFVLLPS